MLSRASVPKQAILTQLAGVPIRDLATFAQVKHCSVCGASIMCCELLQSRSKQGYCNNKAVVTSKT